VGAAAGPAVVAFLANAHHEARAGRVVEIDAGPGGVVCRLHGVRVRPRSFGEERRLLRGRVRRVTTRAVVLEQRIDRGEERVRVGGEALALPGVTQRRRLELDL